MSEANLELVRRCYEVVNSIGRTGDEFVDIAELAPDLWARMAPDVELHERSDLPDAKVYRGREASKEFWRKTQELFAEFRWEPLTYEDLGHAILVEVRVSGVGRVGDVPVSFEEANLFWFRDDQVIRLQAFPSKEEALAAAGEG